ncbi:MAG TPA: hypothetical protein VK973_13260 [Arenicellales bacterium]|nr:hypothetical protein [Arenicellales bacterium]
MNRTERDKVTALEGCRLPPRMFAVDDDFVRNMAWLRDNDAGKVLTGRQKWFLDCLVYKYRRQLGGRELGFEIPAAAPVLADYGVVEDTGAKQRNIFGGEDKPRPTPIRDGGCSSQRELF